LDVDVLIVGAGPAGSTTARYCAGKDLDVLMIDRRTEIGYPVQCGEFLPDAKEMYSMFPKSMDLEELFTLDDSLVAGSSDHIDMISPKDRVYRCPFKGRTLDRRSFDKHLARLAVEAGARMETGASLLSIKDGLAKTTLGDVKARVIVGADGPNSRTAKSIGLSGPAAKYPAITCHVDGDFEPVIKMYFGHLAPGGYAWVIPKRTGANVGAGFNPELLKELPSELFGRFASRLGLTYKDVSMKLVPMSGPIPQTVKDNVLLVGDAAGQVMATNGGGIPIAMIAGRIAGQTVRQHLKGGLALSEYERRWRGVLGKPLADSLWTKKFGDLFFPTDGRTEFAMFVLRRWGLARAVRCTKVFHLF
jgi:digeranylgeranylglycerophospholipid reductase